jgi:DNA polymerase/3'-5' exonuclease PolX
MNYKEASNFDKYLRKTIKGLYITGSLKRKAPIIHDIDYITLRDLDDVLKNLYIPFELIRNGKKHKSIIIEEVQVDFWRAKDRYELFYKRLLRDLDKGHSIYWKKQAKKEGLHLSEVGLFENNHKLDITTKKELKKILKI